MKVASNATRRRRRPHALASALLVATLAAAACSKPYEVRPLNECDEGCVVLAAGLCAPTGIAVDGARVYWTEQMCGTVSSVPRGGGAGTTLVAYGMYGSNDYGTDPGGDPLTQGAVVRIAKP